MPRYWSNSTSYSESSDSEGGAKEPASSAAPVNPYTLLRCYSCNNKFHSNVDTHIRIRKAEKRQLQADVPALDVGAANSTRDSKGSLGDAGYDMNAKSDEAFLKDLQGIQNSNESDLVRALLSCPPALLCAHPLSSCCAGLLCRRGPALRGRASLPPVPRLLRAAREQREGMAAAAAHVRGRRPPVGAQGGGQAAPPREERLP